MDKVERVARGMATRRGRDPDELVPATGYSDAEMVPRWHKEVEWAERLVLGLSAISAMEAVEEERPHMLDKAGLFKDSHYPATLRSAPIPSGNGGWRPIAEALEDEDAPYIDVAWDVEDDPDPNVERMWVVDVARWDRGWAGGIDSPAYGPTWVSATSGDFLKPTHWMPRPSPPGEQAAGAEAEGPQTEKHDE